jgi:hypothetical protein
VNVVTSVTSAVQASVRHATHRWWDERGAVSETDLACQGRRSQDRALGWLERLLTIASWASGDWDLNQRATDRDDDLIGFIETTQRSRSRL